MEEKKEYQKVDLKPLKNLCSQYLLVFVQLVTGLHIQSPS